MSEGEAIDYDYLGEDAVGLGNDIFRIERDDWHVYHFGYAPESPYLRVYESISPIERGSTALSRKNPVEFPAPRDDYGYITSKQIEDKFNPPIITERVSFRNDGEGKFLQFGFYAENDISDKGNILWITGAGYKLLPVQILKREKR